MDGIKIITNNRQAFHEYTIGDCFEAGLALKGTEVKSIRQGKVNLKDGWVTVDDELQAFLHQVSITPYSHGNIYNHPELRIRKLLLKKKELIIIKQALDQKGMTAIPLKLYFKRSWVKIEIGLAKGKKNHDKRASQKEKDDRMEIARAFKMRRDE